jgi:hypothetical protein
VSRHPAEIVSPTRLRGLLLPREGIGQQEARNDEQDA